MFQEKVLYSNQGSGGTSQKTSEDSGQKDRVKDHDQVEKKGLSGDKPRRKDESGNDDRSSEREKDKKASTEKLSSDNMS